MDIGLYIYNDYHRCVSTTKTIILMSFTVCIATIYMLFVEINAVDKINKRAYI